MRMTSALAITALCSVWGAIAGHPYLWLPCTGLAASIVDLFTRSWVTSPRMGRAAAVSAILRSVLVLVGLYALVAQFACVGLGIYWLFRG